MEVPTYQEFNELLAEVQECKREIKFLRSCLAVSDWVDRKQAGIALGVSEQTMLRLTAKNAFVYRREGRKYLYQVDSIRNYLSAQKIDNTQVDERVLRACVRMT